MKYFLITCSTLVHVRVLGLHVDSKSVPLLVVKDSEKAEKTRVGLEDMWRSTYVPLERTVTDYGPMYGGIQRHSGGSMEEFVKVFEAKYGQNIDLSCFCEYLAVMNWKDGYLNFYINPVEILLEEEQK